MLKKLKDINQRYNDYFVTMDIVPTQKQIDQLKSEISKVVNISAFCLFFSFTTMFLAPAILAIPSVLFIVVFFNISMKQDKNLKKIKPLDNNLIDKLKNYKYSPVFIDFQDCLIKNNEKREILIVEYETLMIKIEHNACAFSLL